MTYYQACCLLVFTILGTAILIDPVTEYVIANPLFIARRLIFAWWFIFWTTPRLVHYFTDSFPKTSIKFYSNLEKQYIEWKEEISDDEEWTDQDDIKEEIKGR